MITLILAAVLFISAGVKEERRDTCSVPAKSRQESQGKKPAKKRPLYQLIFMI
jgi:hypothetical protein